MARYVVAVSGGIDSVALLHMMHQAPVHELIVAHVDHGIRDDSQNDARFVLQLAQKYGLPFYGTRVELGADASEEQARDARYEFLRQVASEHNAKVVTAHHADDVMETIAINLQRGTGWRGLATHDSDIVRPLLGYHKSQLQQYVLDNQLEWHEDSTNLSDRYLRNRLRPHIGKLEPLTKRQLLILREEQRKIKHFIDTETARLVGEGPHYSRYFFSHIPKSTAIECLKYVTKGRLTRPQMERAWLAIKTVSPGKVFEAGNGIDLHFTTRNFSLSLIK